MLSKHTWDYFSIKYEDKVFSVTSSPPRRRMFLRYLRPSLILNLGTGPLPNMNQDLIRIGYKVVATDISWKMLRDSSKRFSHQNLFFIRADNRNLPFRKSTFDSILAINSVLPENRSEVDLMLSECFRVLRKRGKFVGFFPAWETSMKAKERLGLEEKLDERGIRVFETNGWQCYQTEGTLSKHLKRAGFLTFNIKRVFLKSEAEVRSIKAIYGVDTRDCLMFEHLAVAVKK